EIGRGRRDRGRAGGGGAVEDLVGVGSIRAGTEGPVVADRRQSDAVQGGVTARIGACGPGAEEVVDEGNAWRRAGSVVRLAGVVGFPVARGRETAADVGDVQRWVLVAGSGVVVHRRSVAETRADGVHARRSR